MNALWSVAVGLRMRWRRFLAVAVLVAAAAGLVSASVETGYTASAPLRVGLAASGGEDTLRALDALRAAAASPAVIDQVAARAGVPVATAARTTVTPAGPATVVVTAVGTTPGQAVALAQMAREAFRAAVAASTGNAAALALAPLRAQLTGVVARLARPGVAPLDRMVLEQEQTTLARSIATLSTAPPLVLLPAPEPVTATALPGREPLRDAVIAFVAVLAALTVGVPLVRAMRGLLPEGAPGAELERRLAVPVLVLNGMRRSPALELVELYRDHLRDRGRITAVQLTGPRACDLGAELLRSAALIGERLVHDDSTPGSRRIPVRLPGTAVLRTLRARRLDRDTARLLVDTGATVLIVDTASGRGAAVEREAALLRGIGAELVAVVVWRGRVPRDPARPWLAPSDDLAPIAPAPDPPAVLS